MIKKQNTSHFLIFITCVSAVEEKAEIFVCFSLSTVSPVCRTLAEAFDLQLVFLSE